MILCPTIYRVSTHFLFLSIAFALPSNLTKPLPVQGDVPSIAVGFNSTALNPLTAQIIRCLNPRGPRPSLVRGNCSYIINQVIPRKANFFSPRLFSHNTYKADDDTDRRSRWRHGNCELSVVGYRSIQQELSFCDISIAANNIFQKCFRRVESPMGGISLIGEEIKGFTVVLQGYEEFETISEKSLEVSEQPAISVSRRTIESEHGSDDSAVSQAIETRDPLTDLTLVSPTSPSNSTLSPSVGHRYAVQCFNPHIMDLPPATGADCSYIIDDIILRLFDPRRELTFGYTDDADIDLSRPEYQEWQHGECVIAVKNYHEPSFDTFRLLDVARTAARIVSQCVDFMRERVGGIAGVGTDGRGFYVYVGGQLDAGVVVDDAMLLPEGIGAES